MITASLENDSQFNNVSLHHIDGRTKPKAHFKQLPLCAYHHDVPISKELQAHPEYKYLVPIHAKGSWGGKAAFNALFHSEMALLELCYELIGEHDFFISHLS
ncbi:Ref family recombination enhancement nuclease [Vibrio sonorensis]|uniref:Ref family recombination enhancement nuclease n=1 Tax=Vibrio sonorensis TaxID=1004316 RepID=UPI001C2F4A28|nr:Ref family recombination enhancement nuclease [Vibrio sonorensis]